MLYCTYCGGSNLTPVYAADGVTIRYYRCAPYPDGCGRIVIHPIVIDQNSAIKEVDSE